MNGFELQQSLSRALVENGQAIEDMRVQAEARARTKSEYRKALASTTLKLKAQGMPATLVHDVARGDGDVATKQFEADLADALWEACREQVMLRKREVDILREQINREYAAEGRTAWS